MKRPFFLFLLTSLLASAGFVLTAGAEVDMLAEEDEVIIDPNIKFYKPYLPGVRVVEEDPRNPQVTPKYEEILFVAPGRDLKSVLKEETESSKEKQAETTTTNEVVIEAQKVVEEAKEEVADKVLSAEEKKENELLNSLEKMGKTVESQTKKIEERKNSISRILLPIKGFVDDTLPKRPFERYGTPEVFEDEEGEETYKKNRYRPHKGARFYRLEDPDYLENIDALAPVDKASIQNGGMYKKLKDEVKACRDEYKDVLALNSEMFYYDTVHKGAVNASETFAEIHNCYREAGYHIISELYAGDINQAEQKEEEFLKKLNDSIVSGTGPEIAKYCEEFCTMESVFKAQVDKNKELHSYLLELINEAKENN